MLNSCLQMVQRFGEGCEDCEDARTGQPSTDC